jgi:hypothetical protein
MKQPRCLKFALSFLLICLAIPASAGASLGWSRVGSSDQPGDGTTGSGQDWKVVASQSETVNRLNVYLGNGTKGKPQIGLYDASRTKLASCTITAPAAGAWNRCSIPDTQITTGQTYLLSVLRPQGQSVVNIATSAATGQSYGSSSSSLATLPSPWANGANYGGQTASVYADSSGTSTPPPPADTTPPDTTITSQPTDPTTSTTAAFSFTGTDNVAVTGYDCRLDSGSWISCSSPATYSALPAASHTFAVRAKDAAGNVDATPATFTWTVQDSTGGGSGGTGGGGGTEPAPIAGLGYHQVFRDDFNTLDRSVWDDHIWYDDAPDPNWSGFQAVDSNGILHLRSSRFMTYSGCSANCYPINTITTQSSGKTFQYGYFEVRMKWPKGDGAWPGFWLYSYKHATDSSQCTTQAGEIDVMEGQGSEPNNWYGTVHSNTNGCSPSDNQNGNNFQETNTDLTAGFHTYAVKWTPSSVTWYLDGVQTHTAPTYATDNQPMFLLLQEWTGGWTKDPDSTTPDVLDNQIDYVTAWQQ